MTFVMFACLILRKLSNQEAHARFSQSVMRSSSLEVQHHSHRGLVLRNSDKTLAQMERGVLFFAVERQSDYLSLMITPKTNKNCDR